MDIYVALVTFPVIFLGELPDKTMFANVLMATQGKPIQVWAGAAIAFAVHVIIATAVGEAIFSLVPHRVVNAGVAVLFLAGAGYSWWLSRRPEEVEATNVPSGRSVAVRAFAVIFVAEWGDLTQILTANLAARYHSPFSVAMGALAALLVVGAIAVTGGKALQRLLDASALRKLTALVLLGLAAYTGWLALR
ncbi:MAG TPA: TMEM165/GDT1 family protein [Acidimicrobiales bacterium]|nr:TMEM165/GDT1 family protein [Acidimicrobiales bacterium]